MRPRSTWADEPLLAKVMTVATGLAIIAGIVMIVQHLTGGAGLLHFLSRTLRTIM